MPTQRDEERAAGSRGEVGGSGGAAAAVRTQGDEEDAASSSGNGGTAAVRTQCDEEHVAGSSGQDQAGDSSATAVVRPQGGKEDAAGSIGQAAGGAMQMPSLRDGGDAAVAPGPRWSPHAVQRVRRAVQGRLPGAGVPAAEQPQLLAGTALQHPPPRRADVSPPKESAETCRAANGDSRQVMKKGFF
jgi:hypothetical protein